jgi:hypothetical protein
MLLVRSRSLSSDIVVVGLEQSSVALEATDCREGRKQTQTLLVPSGKLRS